MPTSAPATPRAGWSRACRAQGACWALGCTGLLPRLPGEGRVPVPHAGSLLPSRLKQRWPRWRWQTRYGTAPCPWALMVRRRRGAAAGPAPRPWSPQPQASQREPPRAHQPQPPSSSGTSSWGRAGAWLGGSLGADSVRGPGDLSPWPGSLRAFPERSVALRCRQSSRRGARSRPSVRPASQGATSTAV